MNNESDVLDLLEEEFAEGTHEPNGEVKKKAKKSDNSDDPKEIFTSFLETDQYILEQIGTATHATQSPAREHSFVLLNKDSGEIEIVEKFEDNGKIYRPITNTLTDIKSVYLPTGIEEYGETYDLIQEIKEYLFSYFEPPKFYENFLPYYILFTWVYHRFPFIAYLHFVGLTGTGKTVAAETVASICYKPVDAAGTVTIPSIFRLANDWRGTLFLDEFDLGSFGKDGYKAVLTFLKTGVSDRAILRVEGEKKKDVQAFMVKSPKIFTSETPITDAGLQSRTFVIKMEKNKRRLPLYKLPNYYEKGSKLRNKLLMWRLKNLPKLDLSQIEFGMPELERFDRRVQQIITPIYYLSDTESRKEILEFAKQQEEETFRERRESLEGQVFQAIVDSYGEQITLSQLAEYMNQNKDQKYQLTERKLSNVVRKKLNFEVERQGHNNISIVITNNERFEELKEYFGLKEETDVVEQVNVKTDDLPFG